MKTRLFRTARLRGRIALPASKSYSVRAFVIAACGGCSRIISPSTCDDALVSVKVAESLGAEVSCQGKGVRVRAARSLTAARRIHVGESGTALRMVLPLVALTGCRTVVAGRGTLKGRPNQHLVTLLTSLGVDVVGTGPGHSVPIVFSGGALRGGRITIDGTLSSQFVSALLIALPMLNEDSIVRVAGRRVVSTDYIVMTCQVLARAGVVIERKGPRTYVIPGGQRFQGLKNFHVPSDYGLAAFWIVAAALTESTLALEGAFDDALIQADGRILEIAARMGIVVKKAVKKLVVSGPVPLRGGTFSLRTCPDLLPILTVAALFAKGRTRFVDIGHVRVKESDRISDLRQELLKIGAEIHETEDSLTVVPRPDQYHGDIELDPHHDHRLAMAFCVLGMKLGLTVRDTECITKSYPDFLEHLASLGAPISGFSGAGTGKSLKKR